MERPCNLNIEEAFLLADRLLALAERGVRESEDDSCIVMYGVIRDCGYKIRDRAERERDRHASAGRWSETATTLSA